MLLAATATGAAPQGSRGPIELFQATGFVGYVRLALGIAGLVATVRRNLELRPERLAPEPLQKSLELAIHAKKIDVAAAQASASATLLSTLVAAGLALRAGGLDVMLANVERATARESQCLGNQVARLGGTVLLFGFLGTTIAVISVCTVLGSLKEPLPSDLYIGIGEALTCMAFALLVALCCFAAFFLLDGKLTRRTLAVREIAEEILHSAARAG
ncbi:MAG: hypothetical protein EXS13_01680 [Planctomycetes bacterium]|nr:hypothetical protein [Planctomycetota bacterium]